MFINVPPGCIGVGQRRNTGIGVLVLGLNKNILKMVSYVDLIATPHDVSIVGVFKKIIPQYVKTRFRRVPFSCRIAVSRRQQSGRGRQRSGPNPSLRRTPSICDHASKQRATVDDGGLITFCCVRDISVIPVLVAELTVHWPPLRDSQNRFFFDK